jgi:TPR repeat protein
MARTHRDIILNLSMVCAFAAIAGSGGRASCQGLIAEPREAPQRMSGGSTSVESEIKLGAAYLTGNGVSKDDKQAAYWFEKAAEAGDASAQDQIGFFYQAGIGVPADPVRAAHWYHLAAASGLPSAKTNLGVAYLWGTGVPKDQQLAAQLFREAADKGNGTAATYLGDLYYFGRGLNLDQSAAEHWYQVGAKLHDPIAYYDLGTLAAFGEHSHDFHKAESYLRKSITGGYVPAMHALALLLEAHPELARTHDEYLSLLQQASHYGQWKSSAALGLLYEEGKLTARDAKAAYYYFQLAILQKGEKSAQEFDSVTQSLVGEIGAEQARKLEAAAQAWYGQHHDAVQLLMRKNAKLTPQGLAIANPADGFHVGQLVRVPPS